MGSGVVCCIHLSRLPGRWLGLHKQLPRGTWEYVWDAHSRIGRVESSKLIITIRRLRQNVIYAVRNGIIGYIVWL